MTLSLYGHSFSSYTWKALIAFYEKDLEFTFQMLGPDQPQNNARLKELSPVGKFPLLEHDDTALFEASVIIEYLDRIAAEPPMIPSDPETALRVRMLDRVFDNYVMNVMQIAVEDAMTPEDLRRPDRVAKAKANLESIYGWLDGQIGNEWAVGDAFTLADCSAAPSLFYADWVHPIPEAQDRLRAYRAKLLARPSVARCVDDARPYRHLFPLGTPDRD